MAWKDEKADDQVSLGSYHSDAYTLPCEPAEEDVRSQVSHDSYDSYCREEELASYRVPKKQGVSQPVYEAWIIYYSDSQDAVQRTTICGLPICTRYAEISPYVSCITESHEQDALADMTLGAVHRYQATHKRSLPARLVRGRATKTYEADLDQRIQKLPRAIQSELDGLLGDREAATGNRFHKRDWTVAMMREQYRYRFASAQYEEVKPKGKRFWKKGAAKRPSEFFFIIRGGEGAVATEDRGMQAATRHGNPWKRVDEAERVLMQKARDIRHYGKDYAANEWRRARSRDRSVSPPPPRRVRLESVAPNFPNPFTSSPELGFRDMPTPPPFRARTPGCDLLPPPGPWQHPGPPPMPRACHWLPGMERPPPPFPMAAPLPLPHFGNLNAFPPPPPPFMPLTQPFTTMQGVSMPPSPPPPPARCFNSLPVPTGGRCEPQINLDDTSNILTDFDFDTFLKDVTPTVSAQSTGATSPPPAPRLSNLTTPTTFSPASSDRTGSSDNWIPHALEEAGKSRGPGREAIVQQPGWRSFHGQTAPDVDRVVTLPQSDRAEANHALADYQMQLMLLENQNKKRLLMARMERYGDVEGDEEAVLPGSSRGMFD